LLAPLSEIVAAASAAVLAIDRGTVKPTDKADGSPLTLADLAADRVIAAGLARVMPALPVISEERVDELAATDPVSFFIVDPIDGTKEFIGGHDDYTVNLALVSAGRPLLGIVAAPALGLMWRGIPGRGADRLSFSRQGVITGPPTAIHTRRWPAENWIAAVSRSHCDSRTDAFIASRPGGQRQAIGSALKFCRLAEGEADLYPRLSPTSEWDIAAGHAVLEAAGGKVTDTRGRQLLFRGNPAAIIIPEFIAWGDPAMAMVP
jgi:3'(2'), 5'-bisphosphate nucleotidase